MSFDSSTDISAGFEPRAFGIDAQTIIGAANTLQDVWDVGGLIDLEISEGPLTFVSDDINDTVAGSGARRIRLRGNTAEEFPKFQSVEYPMGGTTPVVTDESFQGMSLAQARIVDSSDLFSPAMPLGNITITQGATTVGLIKAGQTQTHHGFRRIPYAPNGEVEKWTLAGGLVEIIDLAAKPDAFARTSLWKFKPGDQAHTDGRGTIKASLTSQAPLVFVQSFISGETFALRLTCDTDLVEFFINTTARVTLDRPGIIDFSKITPVRIMSAF